MLELLLALAGQDAPAPVVITNPDWVSRPDGRDLVRLVPVRALEESMSGSAIIRCTVNVEGRLQDCEVTEETPEGWGFGEATLRLADRFQMRPQTVDGVPVGGAQVSIPVTWNLGGPPPPNPTGMPVLDYSLVEYCTGLALAHQAAAPSQVNEMEVQRWTVLRGEIAAQLAEAESGDPRSEPQQLQAWAEETQPLPQHCRVSRDAGGRIVIDDPRG